MKILKTNTAFFGMLLLMIATMTMFYAPIATAMLMQPEYHAIQAYNDLVAIAITAPFLVVASMVALGYKRILNKPKFTKNSAGGDDDDDEEKITAHGGGAAFRQFG